MTRRVPRSRVLAPTVGVLAVLVGITAFVATGDSDEDVIGRSGSVLVDAEPDEPLAIERTPVSYRIVHRVETPSDGDVVVTTDELTVRRPFDSALRSYAGGSGKRDEGEQSRTVASFGRLLIGGGEDALVLANPPAVSPSDIRLAPVLEAALGEGLLELGERREVLGRECQVYRSADPLGTGKLSAPTPEELTETCMDASGLVLEEVLTVQGEILFRRVAVEVDESPELSDEDFAIAPAPLDIDQGGGSVLRMEDGSRPPVPFWTLATVPDGFRACGRFSVIPPQPETTNDPFKRDLLRSSTVDVYVRGPDVVLLEQGGTLGGTHPFQLGDRPVDLGPLGTGDIVLGTQGNAVRALLDRGRYLRLEGTLPVEQLTELARSVEQVDGGTIAVVEGPPSLDC